MQQDVSKAAAKIMQYKKSILLGGLALLTIIFIGVGLVGVTLYQSAVFVKDKVSMTDNVVMDAASQWVHQNMAKTEVQTIISGLSCLDALGGPEPGQVIDYVKAQVGDPAIRTKLEEFGASFRKIQNAGVGACANWIFNS